MPQRGPGRLVGSMWVRKCSSRACCSWRACIRGCSRAHPQVGRRIDGLQRRCLKYRHDKLSNEYEGIRKIRTKVDEETSESDEN